MPSKKITREPPALPRLRKVPALPPVVPKRLVESYNRHKSLESHKRILAVVKELGITTEQILRIRDREMLRLRNDGFGKKEIGDIFGLTRERVRQVLDKYPEPDPERVFLKRFIRLHNPRIKNPEKLRAFLEKYYYRKTEVLARALGVSEYAIMNLRQHFKFKDVVERRIEREKAKLLNWARKVLKKDKKKLQFGYLFKHRNALLSRILWWYKNPGDRHPKADAFDRFLADVGTTRKEVGMWRKKKSREEVEKAIIERAKRPLRAKYSAYTYASDKRGLASIDIVPGILEKLVKEKKLEKHLIGQRVYYIKKGQGKKIERLRRRLVKRTLERMSAGKKKSIDFSLPEAIEAIMQRLERPMNSGSLRYIKTPSGEKEIANWKVFKEAVNELKTEGKILTIKADHQVIYFRPGQEKAAEKLAGQVKK